MSELDPLDMIKQDLENSDVLVQLSAVGHLTIVARALGCEAVMSNLFPILEKYCDPITAKDEVMAAIAKVLDAKFIECCDASKECELLLLQLLEKLAAVEETVIRQNAVESLRSCINHMHKETVRDHVYPLFKRLAVASWFSGRISAASLTSCIYPKLTEPDKKRRLLEFHKSLIRDDMPLVRNEGFGQVADLVKVTDASFYEKYGKFIINFLHSEVSGASKTLIVNITLTFLEELPKKGATPEHTNMILWPWVEKISNNDSWRIRNEFAKLFPRMVRGFVNLHVETPPMVVHAIKLMSDPEPNVRMSIIKSLPDALPLLTLNEHKDSFCDAVQELASDPNPEVREVNASAFITFFKLKSNEIKPSKCVQLLNVYEQDEECYGAQQAICERLADLYKVGDATTRQAVLDFAYSSANNSRWRIRNAVVSNVAEIAAVQGLEAFNSGRMKQYLLKGFSDPAFNVRTTCCEQIKSLSETFKQPFITDLLDEVLQQIDNKGRNYLHRMVVFNIMQNVQNVMTPSPFCNRFLHRILNGMEDPVPNVRFFCAQTVSACAQHLRGQQKLKDLLEKAQSDPDPDVQFYSRKALEALNSKTKGSS